MDGNFIFYSKFDGFYVYFFNFSLKQAFFKKKQIERDELDDIVNICYMKNHEKIFTYLKEKIILIDKLSGKYIEIDEAMNNQKYISDEHFEIENLIVFKLQQKIIKNIQMHNFQEKWQIISSSINIYSYQDFLKNSSNLNQKNEEKV